MFINFKLKISINPEGGGVIVTLYIARTYVLTHRTSVLMHCTYVLTHRTSLTTTSFSNQFSFLIARQRQLVIYSTVAKLTLLSHSINYRYYKPKPTSTRLSQPNPLLSPIRLTRSPVAPIRPTGQSTFHLRPVRRSRDPAYVETLLRYRILYSEE